MALCVHGCEGCRDKQSLVGYQKFIVSCKLWRLCGIEADADGKASGAAIYIARVRPKEWAEGRNDTRRPI